MRSLPDRARVALASSALRLAAALAAVSGLCAPAAAEVTRATEDSFVSRHEVVVAASPKAVWLALIAPAQWWRSEHTWSGEAANLTLTPQASGCFCETIPEVDEPGRFTLQGSVEHMRVIQAYPEQALRMQGALGPLQSEPVTGILTITLSAVKQGTRIVWEYNVGGPMRYEVEVISKAVDGVMGAQLGALAKQLGPVSMSPPELSPEPDPVSAEQPEQAQPATDDAASKAGVGSGTAAAKVPKRAAPPVIKPAASVVTGSAAKPAIGSATGPTAKPPAKPASVDDVFGDLKDDAPKP